MLIVINLNRHIAQKTAEWMESIKSGVLLDALLLTPRLNQCLAGRKERSRSRRKSKSSSSRYDLHLLFPATKKILYVDVHTCAALA